MEKILNKIQNSKHTKNNNNINCKDHCGTRNNIFNNNKKSNCNVEMFQKKKENIFTILNF